jgi:hypothetical protein
MKGVSIMISRNEAINLTKIAVRKTFERLPEILSQVPQLSVAGGILSEVREIAKDVKAEKNSEETKQALDKIIEENGGEEAFVQKLKQEIKNECDTKKPKYITCVTFYVKEGKSLTKEEQDYMIAVLTDEEEPEEEEVQSFVQNFLNEYFGGSIDNDYEITPDYVTFNFFCDMEDHVYKEGMLEEMRYGLNRIINRDVLDEYMWAGTDDSVVMEN